MVKVEVASQDAVGVVAVEGGQRVQRGGDVTGEVWRHRELERTLVHPGFVRDLAPVGENHHRERVRLVDARNDVAVGDQLLDLEGVGLPVTAASRQEDQHRVARLGCGNGRAGDGVRGDVLEVSEHKPG